MLLAIKFDVDEDGGMGVGGVSVLCRSDNDNDNNERPLHAALLDNISPFSPNASMAHQYFFS